MNHQNNLIIGTKMKISNIEKGFKKTEAIKSKSNEGSRSGGLKKQKTLNSKKQEMIRALNSQILGSNVKLDKDSVYEIALSWM